MKIYTYKNSTQLSSTEYWDEIKSLPHFCASEVLSIGMKSYYGREGFQCLSTIDELIKNLFPGWTASYNDIKRYEHISSIVNSLDNDEIDENIISTLKKNKRNLMDSVKFIFELQNNSNLEFSDDIQKIFYDYIIKEVTEEDRDYWQPEWKENNYVKYNIEQAIHECNIGEISKLIKKIYIENNDLKDEKIILKLFNSLFDEFGQFNPNEKVINQIGFEKERILSILGYDAEELKFIRNKSIGYKKDTSEKALVFHGLYRLRPIHIRLFKELEGAGYEVILLNCFNDEYKNTYSCWINLYKELIDVFKIDKGSIIFDKTDGVNHRKTGILFGNLIEGNNEENYFNISKQDICTGLDCNTEHIKEIFKDENKSDVVQLLSKKKEEEYKGTIQEIEEKLVDESKLFLKFNSTMQFVQYVSEKFDETVDDNGIHKIGKMKEQFYGAKGTDMNNIFQVFYPDEFGVKPFLSYPIGQFILSLYNMWDEKENELILNNKDLVECFNLDIWDEFLPNMIYDKVKGYAGLEKESKGLTVSEFKSKIELLISKIDNLKSDKNRSFSELQSKMKNLNFFNIESCEYRRLIEVIDNINTIAEKIFKDIDKHSSKKHFSDMINVIKEEKGWTSLSGEERKLIDKINEKLEDNSNDEGTTDVETVRETLQYYLSNSTGENINWLVRDLDQIEGDILSEAARDKKDLVYPKTYHYCMLSNENMINELVEELPWPLTINCFSNENQSEVRLLKVISNNIVKYKRCLLFQGMYYLVKSPKIKLKLSYIEYENDKKSAAYYLIDQIMNTIDFSGYKKDYEVDDELDNNSFATVNNEWGTKEKEVMSCCPYKFMFSYGLGCLPEQYNNQLQVKFYLGRIIKLCIAIYWDGINKKLINKSKEDKFKILEVWCYGAGEHDLPNFVFSHCGQYMVDSEIRKLIKSNLDYMFEQRDFNSNESVMDKILTSFDEQLNLCWNKEVKKHSLYSFYNDRDELRNIPIKQRISDFRNFVAQDYINDFLMDKNNGFYMCKNYSTKEEYKISEHICNYCSFKSICLYSYRSNAKYLLRKNEGLLE